MYQTSSLHYRSQPFEYTRKKAFKNAKNAHIGLFELKCDLTGTRSKSMAFPPNYHVQTEQEFSFYSPAERPLNVSVGIWGVQNKSTWVCDYFKVPLSVSCYFVVTIAL